MGDNLSYILYFCIVPPVIISCFCICCIKIYFDYKKDNMSIRPSHMIQITSNITQNVISNTSPIPRNEKDINEKPIYKCFIDDDIKINNQNILLGKNNETYVIVVNPTEH